MDAKDSAPAPKKARLSWGIAGDDEFSRRQALLFGSLDRPGFGPASTPTVTLQDLENHDSGIVSSVRFYFICARITRIR